MSASTAEPLSRRERAALKAADRTEHCLVCKCERFELGEFKDGFTTCLCLHTQWGHKRKGAAAG